MKVGQFYAKNQFVIMQQCDCDTIYYLQSYNSIVVKVINNYIGKQKKTIILGRDWDYSTTTSKYVYLFLEEYGDIKFYGVTNKRAFINKLIKEGKIDYDEEME